MYFCRIWHFLLLLTYKNSVTNFVVRHFRHDGLFREQLPAIFGFSVSLERRRLPRWFSRRKAAR